MRIDGPAVAAARRARGLSLGQVAGRMRRAGLARTTTSWVNFAEHGRWADVPVEWAAALADAVGSDLATITGRTHLTRVI